MFQSIIHTINNKTGNYIGKKLIQMYVQTVNYCDFIYLFIYIIIIICGWNVLPIEYDDCLFVDNVQ